MAGRPSKFTPETARKICDGIEAGLSYDEAAKSAGVTYVTFLSWKQKGEKAETGPFLEFFKDIKKAEDCSKAVLVSRIKDAGKLPQHWQANAWLLERRFPKEFGKSERVEHTGKDGGPIRLRTADEMTDDELAQIIQGKK